MPPSMPSCFRVFLPILPRCDLLTHNDTARVCQPVTGVSCERGRFIGGIRDEVIGMCVIMGYGSTSCSYDAAPCWDGWQWHTMSKMGGMTSGMSMRTRRGIAARQVWLWQISTAQMRDGSAINQNILYNNILVHWSLCRFANGRAWHFH